MSQPKSGLTRRSTVPALLTTLFAVWFPALHKTAAMAGKLQQIVDDRQYLSPQLPNAS